MNPPSPVLDVAHNPFLEREDATWTTDDVANTRVINYLRRKIAKLEFFINHPITNDPYDNDTLNHLNFEINRWKDLLNKARYN